MSEDNFRSNMKKKLTYIIIAGVIVAIVFASTYFASLQTEKSAYKEFEYLTSGPFSVIEYQHKLGEDIHIITHGIAPTEKGTIRVYTPKNVEYVSYPFDGSVKSDFNVYFKVTTSARKDRCSPDDLIGIWTMRFEGVPYPPIQFEFINEYILGGEANIKNLCQYVT